MNFLRMSHAEVERDTQPLFRWDGDTVGGHHISVGARYYCAGEIRRDTDSIFMSFRGLNRAGVLVLLVPVLLRVALDCIAILTVKKTRSCQPRVF